MSDLVAHWALWGKLPGDARDYRVLSRSRGPIPADDLAALVRRQMPGSPPARPAPGPGSPPWITFTPCASAGEPALAVSVLELGEDRDRDGRLIAPTRIYYLPFARLAEARASYAGLAAAVRSPSLPLEDGAPLALAVEPLRPDEMVSRLDEVGLDAGAHVAALLLESPVALTSASELSLERRLEWLDALAALLPYGLRADLAAGTWADDAGHALRLNFGAGARTGQRSVDWDRPGTGAPALTSPQGVSYQRTLLALGRAHGTREVVAHLAGQAAVCRFQTPKAALDALDQLDPQVGVVAAVRTGSASPDDVRATLDRGRFSPEDRPALVRFLLSQRSPEDLPRLAREWTPDLLAELGESAELALLSEGGRELLDGYVGIAAEHRVLEPLLVRLLRWTSGLLSPAQARQAEAEVVRLVRGRLRSPWADPAGAGGMPDLRTSLVERPEPVFELLAQGVENGGLEEAAALMDWAEGAGGPARSWLEPIRVVLDPSTDEDLCSVAAARLPQGLPSALGLFFRVALLAGTDRRAFPAVWRALTRDIDDLDPDQRRRWLGLLHDFAGRPATPATSARLDLLFLLLGERLPVPLLRRLDAGDGVAYREQFHDAWRYVSSARRRDVLAEAVVAGLERSAWTTPDPLAENVLVMLRGLVHPEMSYAAWRLLATIVTAGVGARPEIADLPGFREQWRSILEGEPELARAMAVARLRRDLRDGLELPEVAARCAELIRHGYDPCRLLPFLYAADFRADAAGVETLLAHLWTALEHAGLDTVQRTAIEARLVEGVLTDQLGRETAGAYRLLLAASMRERMARWEAALNTGRVDLGPSERDEIHEAASRIARLTRPPGRAAPLLDQLGRLRPWLDQAGRPQQ